MKQDTLKSHIYTLLRAYALKYPEVGNLNWFHACELSEQLIAMLKHKRVLRVKR